MLPGELLRQRRTQGKAMDTLADTAARFGLAKWNGRAIDVRSELVYRIVTSNLGGQCTHTIPNCQYLICVSRIKLSACRYPRFCCWENCFIHSSCRFFISSGERSSLRVAIVHVYPSGSVKAPQRSPQN